MVDVEKIANAIRPLLLTALERKQVRARIETVRDVYIKKFGFNPESIEIHNNTVIAKTRVTKDVLPDDVKQLLEDVIHAYINIEGERMGTRITIGVAEVTDYTKEWKIYEKNPFDKWVKEDPNPGYWNNYLLLYKEEAVGKYSDLLVYILLTVEEFIPD